ISLSDSGTWEFNISGNPFTCLPNYVPAMSGENEEWLSYPLCNTNDLDNNPFGCINGISGTVFNDENANCESDEGEDGVVNFPIKLLDDEGNLVATTFTHSTTYYNFLSDPGS